MMLNQILALEVITMLIMIITQDKGRNLTNREVAGSIPDEVIFNST
jgi:uncharacterized membrane protein